MPESQQWVVIVQRAWRDTNGIRVRLLRTDSDGGRHEVVESSIDDVLAVVEVWLRELASGVIGSAQTPLGRMATQDDDGSEDGG